MKMLFFVPAAAFTRIFKAGGGMFVNHVFCKDSFRNQFFQIAVDGGCSDGGVCLLKVGAYILCGKMLSLCLSEVRKQ